MSDDILYMSASDLLGQYQDQKLSPVEVTRATLERISSLDEKTNAYIVLDADAALEAAGQSEGRWRRGEPKGLVDGVPTSIKDLVLAKGWPNAVRVENDRSGPSLGLGRPVCRPPARAWCRDPGQNDDT